MCDQRVSVVVRVNICMCDGRQTEKERFGSVEIVSIHIFFVVWGRVVYILCRLLALLGIFR